MCVCVSVFNWAKGSDFDSTGFIVYVAPPSLYQIFYFKLAHPLKNVLSNLQILNGGGNIFPD